MSKSKSEQLSKIELKEDKVIQGDCIEVMKQIPKNSIDAIVTDPPYGLAFMGKEWDSFSSKEYQDFCYKWGIEALKVLKPGAYCLAFSGTRTYHRMVCGLDDAGFDIKDMINWMYGSGFPKSYDISKGIDKHFGKKQKKGNIKIDIDGKPRTSRVPNEEWNLFDDEKMDYNPYETIPATPEAKKWDGWGTALKPAHEPVVVAQKPYDDTYVNNVLEYGVGGLNIDGCRIGNEEIKTHGKRDGTGISLEWSKYESDKGYEGKNHRGRWPANVMFSHHPECRLVGTKKVGSGKKKHNQEIHRKELEDLELSSFTADNCGFKSNRGKGLGNYGEEEVPKYVCHPRCPIRLVNEQSGISSDTIHKRVVKGNVGGGYTYTKGQIPEQDIVSGYTDSGGASRFFYNAKVHKSERNAGCENLYWKKYGDNEITQITKEEYNQLPKSKRLQGNYISTLKPINVMRWLVRLVCPKNSTVLDPFAGSGTTGVAAIIEGIAYMLIEKRKDFADILIPKRLDYWEDPNHWEVLKDHNNLPETEKIKNKKENRSLEEWL